MKNEAINNFFTTYAISYATGSVELLVMKNQECNQITLSTLLWNRVEVYKWRVWLPLTLVGLLVAEESKAFVNMTGYLSMQN